MTSLIQNDCGLIFCTASGEAKCWLKENKQNIDIPAGMIQVEAGDWVQVQLSKSRKVLRVYHLDSLNIPLQTRVRTNKTGVRHVEVRVLLKVVDQVTLHSPCIGYVDCAAGQLNLKLNEKLFAWCQKFQDPGTYHAWTISPEPNVSGFVLIKLSFRSNLKQKQFPSTAPTMQRNRPTMNRLIFHLTV
jgi:hypothetical protein